MESMPLLNELDALIEDHRAMYRDDLRIDRLVARQPPASRDSNTGIIHQHEAAALGMNMSSRLYRFIEAPSLGEFPWYAALRLSRVECRRKHPHHRSGERPYWRGSLCHQAASLVVIGGESHGFGPMSAEQAGAILRVDRMEPLLRNVFRYITEQIDLARWRAERRQREDQGYSSVFERSQPLHHAVGGLHERECGNPQCAA